MMIRAGHGAYAGAMGTTFRWNVVVCAAIAGGCGTASDRIDPRDLELRDLLGLSPDVALAWDPAQRAAARDVLAGGLHEAGGIAAPIRAGDGRTIDDRIARALAALDRERAAGGADALGVVRATLAAARLDVAARRAPGAASALAAIATATAATGAGAPAQVELLLASAWDQAPAWGQLLPRGLDALSAIALEAGHREGPVVVVPWPRLGVIAGYAVADDQPPRLLVNPVLLASLEPAAPADVAAVAELPRARDAAAAPEDGTASTARGGAPSRPALGATTAANTAGNPYSFYGSIAECAYAQRTRCETCLGGGTCTPVTDAASGADECNALAASDGRGYYLLCINLGLAITSVSACAADAAPGCVQDDEAGGTLARLEVNASFLADAACGGALDACLTEIYGPPPGDFPDPGPGTPPPPPRPPRDTSIDCGDSCSSDNSNCEASPSCNCEGPSCNNSFSCDSTCSSSNSGGGCGGGGGCDSCEDSGGGGGGGGSCGGDGGSGGGGGSCGGDSGGGCGGDGGGGCGGDGGGGCGGDSGGGGCGGSGGGGCSGGSGGGGGCSGGGGGGSSSSCNVARRAASPGALWLVSIAWAGLPLPIAVLIRRRARRQRERRPPTEGGTDGGPAGGDTAGEAARDDEVAP